jgi:hypothetical protein
MALHLLAVGSMSKGHASLRVAPHNAGTAAELDAYLEQSMQPPLQDLIDYAAELAELEDDMLDREFWARGGW